jgi:chromosome segregation ATPase
MLGTLGLGVGLSLPLWPANLAASMAAQGFGAATFVIGGLVLLATAGQLRRASALQRAVLQESQQRREQLRAVQATLLELESNHHAAKLPAVGEEMQHALLALQRQDEKVNNLTKAIKMYGKPLMEIASQGQDLDGSLAQVKTLVEGGSESTRQAVVRLETQLRNQAPAGKELTELNQQVGKLAGRIEALATKAEPPSLAPLQQQLGRLEVAIAAVAQRLEDSELRKGVLRLEATAQQSRELLQEVLRGEPVQKASSDLAQRLDGAVRGLQDGLARLRDGNLGGLETAVRDIQREVSGVATSVAQIHVAVKNGVRVATTAAVPPPAAATPAAAPTAAPTPAAAPAAASAPTAAAPTADGGGYQTGSRATPSKNVLGAIAKLKQMKG